MMKKVLVLLILLYLLIPNIFASIDKRDVEETYQVQTGEILKSSYKEIEIKLTKEGVSYKEISNLFITNEKGYILFLLPEGKNYDQLALYDLKTNNKERLIKLDDITRIPNCEGYYSIRKINDSWAILACPKIIYKEIEIEIDSLLYNDNEGCSVGCYKMVFPEINAGIKDYLTDDFRVVFRLLIDNTFYLGEMGEGLLFEGGCSNLNLIEHKQYNGIVCEGKPNISEAILFTNLSITTKDKDLVYNEKQSEKDRKERQFDLAVILIVGIIVVFFITLFQKVLSNLGEKIYMKDRLWKKIIFWTYLSVVLLCIIYLLITFI